VRATKSRTSAEGMAAIERAKRIAETSKQSAIVRLYAIAMVFYRHPVGERACKELHVLMGEETTSALFFLTGYADGGSGRDWDSLAAFPDHHESPVTSH